MRFRRTGAGFAARAARAGFAAVALAAIVAGCGSAVVPTPSVQPAIVTPAPSTQAAVVTPAPSVALSPGLPPPSPGAAVVMDPTLLDILPEAIGDAKVGIEPGSFADAAGDPSFAASVDAAAFAIVVDGEDLASGVVAHLRPDVYSDGFFRDWRDSYDEGACAQADGVASRAEVGLDGDRTMYIATCTGGLRTYHVYVPEREVIISLFSLGEQRFGERLLTGLRP
jgi:hypothetical protein